MGSWRYGHCTEDKIFLLSKYEVEKYLSTNKSIVARIINGEKAFWLRSTEQEIGNTIDCLKEDGSIVGLTLGIERAVRPALWVNISNL